MKRSDIQSLPYPLNATSMGIHLRKDAARSHRDHRPQDVRATNELSEDATAAAAATTPSALGRLAASHET